MNRSPPPHRRSNRVAGSATSALSDRPFETRHDRVPVRVGEVDEEPARHRVVGRKREAEQAPLAAGGNDARHIEERCRQQRAVVDHSNPPALLDDELDVRRRGILDELDRSAQSGYIRHDMQLRECVQRRTRSPSRRRSTRPGRDVRGARELPSPPGEYIDAGRSSQGPLVTLPKRHEGTVEILEKGDDDAPAGADGLAQFAHGRRAMLRDERAHLR